MRRDAVAAAAPTIASRVTRGMVFASLVTALTLASASAAISFWVWRAREARALRATAVALSQAVEREMREEGTTPAQAAPEALRESSVTGYHVEFLEGDRLLAANAPGPAPDGWTSIERDVGEGVRLRLAAPARGGEALRVLGGSLLLAAPLCLLVALFIGRAVARQTTRPLVEFKRRIGAARPFEPLPGAEIPGAPAEVRDLDAAFHALWGGLRDALAREVDFAADASHELRTPLTRVHLHAERALHDAGPAARRSLTELMEEVDRMVRLLDSLLVMARDVSAGLGRAEVVNLADTVRAVGARVLGPRRADLGALPDEALARGDEDLLSIAVENLFDNAGKFGAPERPVGLSLEEKGGRIHLAVTTPGSRITDTERARLFDRFYRTPEARATHPGHGLGLPLARHIARLHGGDVTCISRPDQDACFELVIPSVANPTAAL